MTDPSIDQSVVDAVASTMPARTPPPAQPAAPRGGTDSAIDSSIGDAVASTLQGTAAELRNSVRYALPVNPDAEAQTRRYAAAANTDLVTARAMPDVVKLQAQMSQFDADMLSRKFPTTAQLLSNPDLAKITHDDIGPTTQVEQAVKQLVRPAAPPIAMPSPSFMDAFGGGASALIKGLGGSFNNAAMGVNTVAAALPVIADKLAGGTTAQDWWFRNMVDPLKDKQSVFEMDPNSPFAAKAVHTVGSLMGMLSQITLSGAGGAGPEAAAVTDTAGAVVKNAVEHGAKAMAFPALADAVNMGRQVYEATGDPGAAFKAASAQWMGTSAMGVVPLSLAGNAATRIATGAVSGAASGELVRQGMNAALPNKMQSPFDWEQVFLAATAGGVMGGVMGPRAENATIRPGLVQHYQDAQLAAKAEGQSQTLVDIAKAAAASKLRERDPEAFKQFVKDAADEGDLQGVYIEGAKLAETLQHAGIDADALRQTMPDVMRQMDAALGENAPRNGLVRIPIEDFATHIAGSKIEEPLMQHLRVDPEGGTVAESEAFKQSLIEDMAARAAAIGAAHQSDTAYQASLDRVINDLQQRLQTIGMRADMAEANAAPLAAFYQVHADRTGMLPHEFADRYPVRFSNEALKDSSAILKQGDLLDLGALLPESIKVNNGSGESSASLEAQSRLREEKAKDRPRYIIDTRTGALRPLRGVDAVDTHAGAGQIVVQKNVGAGKWTVMSSGGDVTQGAITRAIARARAGGDLRQDARGSQPRDEKPMSVIPAGTTLHHGAPGELRPIMPGGTIYLTTSPHEAGVYARNEVAGTARESKGNGLIHSFKVTGDSKTKSIDRSIEHALLNGDVDRTIAAELAKARKAGGVDFLTYSHPSGVHDGSMQVYVPVYPHELTPAGKAEVGALRQDARGTYSPTLKTISVLKGADLSTFQHELGHFFLDTMGHLAVRADAPASVKADMATLLKWFGVSDIDAWHRMSLDEQRQFHEQFATGWETYLMKGQAPSLEMRSLFARFRSWMLNVYKSMKGAPGDFTPEVKGVFDRMIASEDAIHEAELARKYMPLFDSPEKSGMTPEEWSAYQATGKDATEIAIENLIGKTLKDMAKTDRLRTASLKAVQKDAAQKRIAVKLEVQSEVMRTPVYRAWSFLTGKDSNGLPDDVNAEHQAALRDWSEKRAEHETQTKASARNAAWEAAPASHGTYKNPGLAKGQWLAKNRARIDLDIKRAMLDYDEANPKPVAPTKKDTGSNDPITGAGKLNTAALKEIAPESVDSIRELRMTSPKGLPPGIVADMFGFPDAQALVKALVNAEPPRAVVEGITDQRMLERFGEIATPEAMARTADELVQNEVRSIFVATELRALKKATGKPKEMIAAAKEAAANTIDTKRVRDINPRQFDAAETRSATQAEKAMMKGDTEGAAIAKRDQLLNMELGRAARDAKEFVDTSVDYLKKFDKASVREGIDLEYRDQIDALLDRADLRKSVSGTALDKREALLAFVERMSSEGYKPAVPEELLNEAQRWHYKDMPLVTFKGLVDAVKSIEHLGKLKSKLRDLQETRAIGELADEVKASAAKLPQLPVESNRGLTRMQSAWVKTKAFGRSAQASMLKMEQMLDWLDARNPNGTLNRVVFRRIADAGVHENTLLATVKADIDKLVESHLDDIAKTKGVFTADGLIDGATGRPQKFTTKEMLMLAGNMGNESNAAKLAKGEGWDQQAVWDFLNKHMTTAHWDFVEGMGKTLESLWPEKLAMDRRLGNTSPEKIAPRPFTTPDGKKRSGWYWPMMYDPARAQDVAERGARAGDAMFENIYSRANSDTGRMNTRNENYARPLLLDLDALPRMIKEEIHDVSHREAVIDADRFLSHPTVRKAIIESLSQEHYDQIRPWLQSIANDGKLGTSGDRGWKWMNKIASEARTRATMVGLGFRLTTAIVHGTSAGAESIAELGPVWFGSGLKDFANPLQWSANKDFIFERSGEMRNRMNEVDRDIREHLRAIDLQLMDPTSSAMSRGADILRAHAYTLIGGLDMASALPTWMGAYKKAMTPVERGGLGMGEEDAVYFADKTVRNAHGGTGIKDLAAIQRGTEFQKLFTMFYTFWNHNINRIMDTAKLVTSSEHRAAMKEANHWSDSQLAATVIMRTLIYTIGVQVMHSLLHPPKDDDADSWALWAAKEMGAAATGGIPIARDLYAHYVTGKDYGVTPAAGMVDMIGRSGTDAANALTGQKVSDKWMKHTLTTAGVAFNLPLGQPGSTIQFLWDVGDGTQHPESATDWWNGILHGDMKKH